MKKGYTVKNDDNLTFEPNHIKLSEKTQRLFDEKIEATKEEINSFYIKDDMRTHYIVFLNFLQVLKYAENLKRKNKVIVVHENGNTEVCKDEEDNGAILSYILEHFPHRKTAAMFFATIEYFHPGEVGEYHEMSIEELDIEKTKLKNKQGLWNFIG